MRHASCEGEELAPSVVSSLYRRIDIRILLMLSITYLMDSLDRLNIGYAQHQISERMHLSIQDYGFVSGVFFIGYIICEIPAMYLLEYSGPRKTFARIAFLWGLCSSCMCLVTSVHEFVILRFLLGVFEAGFAPACLYYMTMWYPRWRMAKVVSFEQAMGPLAGIISGPLSGLILDRMDLVAHIDGWRWMFFIEGVPSIILAIVIFATLPDAPSEVKWLSQAEKSYVQRHSAAHKNLSHKGFSAVVSDPRVWILGVVFLTIISGIYTLGFWLPHLIRNSGIKSNFSVGLISAIPYVVAIPSMILWSYRADRKMERVHHIIVPMTLAGILFSILGVMPNHDLIYSLTILVLIAATLYPCYTIFLSTLSDILRGVGASTGYALINIIGLAGGFLSPYTIGLIVAKTGNIYYGVESSGILMLIGSLTFFLCREKFTVSSSPPLNANSAT